MGRKKSKKSDVLKVKITPDEEIEYMLDGSTQDTTTTDTDLAECNGEPEPELVTTSDGNMRIKLENDTIFVHVCRKCKKSFNCLLELKKHLLQCRSDTTLETNDESSNIFKKPLLNPNANAKKRRILCFCCDEDKSTAHNGDKSCEKCDFKFHTTLGLEKHIFSLHSKITDFPCKLCKVKCPTRGILDLHEQTHKAVKPFSCKNCGRDFTRKYHLQRHLQHTSCDASTKKVFLLCNVCDKKFTRIDNLREHLRGHTGESNRKREFQCTYCEKSFYGSSLLNIHIRTHTGEKPFPCDVCEKSFSSTGALRKHRRMHTGERPYKCSVCENTFAAKETLNRHFKIHTGEKPYKCHICEKKFIQATQLKAHMFHHTGENGYECEICKRVFNRKSRWLVHMKYIHQGEKPMECNECGSTFTSRSDLTRHLKLHLGIKEFKCDVCERQFSAKASLVSHLLTHTSEEPVKCELCHRTFIRMDCLSRHVRKVHRDALFEVISEAETKRMKLIKTVSDTDAPEPGSSSDLTTQSNYDVSEENSEDDDDNNDEKNVETYSIIEVKEEEVKEDERKNSKENQKTVRKSEILVVSDDTDKIVIPKSGETIFMDEVTLIKSIVKLLNLLVDQNTLESFGWPKTSVEDVLCSVIKRCGHTPADYEDCSDYTTKMRENTKLLFTVVIDDESIKSLLNNHTIDEVILHVLKAAQKDEKSNQE